MPIDPANWLLTPSPAGDGKPWGTGTNMAGRAKTTATPWDEGCRVTTYVGGYAAMNEMLTQLEKLIKEATASKNAPGDKGHVYFANWRFNCQRDLSTQNDWKTDSWDGKKVSKVDQTALGLVLRLMQCGVTVRLLVWLPTTLEEVFASLEPHLLDHIYLWNVIKAENDRLAASKPVVPLGIVGLDRRIAGSSVSGAHHQKMMVIRSPGINVAFCGGVDLAFTRRDAPTSPDMSVTETVLSGDWQSGTGIPGRMLIPLPGASAVATNPGIIWPPDSSTVYQSAAGIVAPWPAEGQQDSDLPVDTNSKTVCLGFDNGAWKGGTCTYKDADGKDGKLQPIYGAEKQLWHDQHLKLEGSIVSTLEWQFAERWIDSPRMDGAIIKVLNSLSSLVCNLSNLRVGSVYFSTDIAYTKKDLIVDLDSVVKPLTKPIENAVTAGPSIVQMWRTIPMRERTTDPFKDGEFTVMAGVAKAMSQASQLIWIFDQYFWSEPAARLLNYRLSITPSLHVLIILPPHADVKFRDQHRARQLALTELTLGLSEEQRKRVGIYNMWHPDGRGIYVHAKTHTYDGALLVCGSANMNRRSFTCDTELACAVVDTDVVKKHQEKLWNMLFGRVSPDVVKWPDLDLNASKSGAGFFAAFTLAVASSGSYLIPDPWDDDNPLYQPQPPARQKIVALPHGVPRPVAFLGPKHELVSGVALDPGSLDPVVEQDVLEQVGSQQIPRPVRLDDIVKNIEKPDDGSSPPKYSKRKEASLPTDQVIRLAGTLYSRGGYEFTETASWFKQLCAGLPCFKYLGWPGYKTTVIENVMIDGHQVVLQLWKGWCQRFAGLTGMPGGVGAEVGVYRRIKDQDQFRKFVNQLGVADYIREKLGNLPDKYFTDDFFKLTDSLVWWPFTELNAKVEFTLKVPTNGPVDGPVIFRAGAENTYWLCKWMTPDSYDKFAADPSNGAPSRLGSSDCVLEYTVTGADNKAQTFSWRNGDGNVTFP